MSIRVPHVVLSGNVELKDAWKELSNIVAKSDAGLIRVTECFLNVTENTLLVRATAVEEVARTFYVVVSQGKDAVTIRLDPLTDPEKTGGVKAALAFIAARIMHVAGLEESAVSKTNLAAELKAASGFSVARRTGQPVGTMPAG